MALAVSVMRARQPGRRPHRGRVESAVKAIEVLSPRNVQAIATRSRTYDFFERTAVWQDIPSASGCTPSRPSAPPSGSPAIDYEARDRLMVTALLHDLGKLVLVHAYPGYPRRCTATRARRRSGSIASAASSASTTRWSAA